jgi:hypothetical protein
MYAAPATSAPARPTPSPRAHAAAPSPAISSFAAMIRPQVAGTPNSSAGQCSGNNQPDCQSPSSGEPPKIAGFHSGRWPSESWRRASSSSGWNTSAASAAPSRIAGSPSGRPASHGCWDHSTKSWPIWRPINSPGNQRTSRPR